MSTDAYDPVDPAAAELARRDRLDVPAEIGLFVFWLVIFLSVCAYGVLRVVAL